MRRASSATSSGATSDDASGDASEGRRHRLSEPLTRGYVCAVILAELEAYHSRPIAPTRRIALGRLDIPTDPAPGFGGVLLGAVLARFFGQLDEDTAVDVVALLGQVEDGRRVSQPRARHRLQEDRVGLRPCHHRLLGHADSLLLDIDDSRGTPAQHVLCAVYASAGVPPDVRPAVLGALRRGISWRGEIGPSLLAHLAGRGTDLPASLGLDPVGWAMQVLQLDLLRDDADAEVHLGGPFVNPLPTRRVVQQAFRDRIRAAHPDHGAADAGAAQRIAELSEARRILLG